MGPLQVKKRDDLFGNLQVVNSQPQSLQVQPVSTPAIRIDPQQYQQAIQGNSPQQSFNPFKSVGDFVGSLFSGTSNALKSTDALSGVYASKQKAIEDFARLNAGKPGVDNAVQQMRQNLLNNYSFAGKQDQNGQTSYNLTPAENLAKAAGISLQATSEVAPLPIGAAAKGASVVSKFVRGAVPSAIASGVGSAGAQLADSGQVNPVQTAESALAGGAIGGAIPVAVSAIKSAFRPPSQPQVLNRPEVNFKQALPEVKTKLPQEQPQVSLPIAVGENMPTLPIEKGRRIKADVQSLSPQTDNVVINSRQTSYANTLSQDGNNVNNGATPLISSGNKITRFASKTIPKSEYVGPEVSKIAEQGAPTYIPGANKEQLRLSLESIKSKGLDAHANDVYDRVSSAKNGSIAPQDAVDAISVAQALEYRNHAGDANRAADIYDKLSSHFTASGQLTQVASLLANRTPSGIAFKAERDLKRAGVEVTKDITDQISKYKSMIGKTEMGTDARGIAVNELGKYISSKLPKSSLGSRVADVWRAGLLTGPVTTTGNLLGNFSAVLGKKALSDPIAALADNLQSFFTRQRTKTVTFKGAFSGSKEGFKLGGTYLKTGYDKRNAKQKYDIPSTNYGDGKLGKIFHNYTQAIYRYQGAQDQPFYYSALKNSLHDQALAKAKTQGLAGTERKAFINSFVSSPTSEAAKIAENDANRAVFANETKLGNFAAAGQKALGPIGTFLVPFTRIPASIAMRVIDNTPIGTAREVVRQISNVAKGKPYDQRAMSEAIGNGSIGVILIPVGYALMKAGDITLGYPKDPKEQELWKQEGKQPYSVRIGNQWESLNYVQPFGTILAIGGEINNAAKRGSNFFESLMSGSGVAGQSIINQSFLKGLAGTINAINDPQRYAEQLYEQTAGSIVPNAVRTVARATDPVQRQVNGPLESLQAGIPGIRENLAPKTDTFGNPLPALSSPIDQLANPLRPSSVIATAGSVTNELRRLQDANNGLLPNDISASSLGKNINLTKEQIQQITNYTGPRVQQALSSVINDPRYSTLTDEQKSEVLSKVNRDVVAAYKADWGVKNGLITPDKGNLTNDQKALLLGKPVDWLQTEIKNAGVKAEKSKRSKPASSLTEGYKEQSKKTTKVAKPKRIAARKTTPRAIKTRSTSNAYKYTVPISAGGSIAKPKIKLAKGGSSSRLTVKKRAIPKPKVSSRRILA